MRELSLVGLNEDGSRLVLVDDAGEEFTVPADDRIRAALRRPRSRPSQQVEIDMDSALRPRDIQARVRGGDSPEEVAALAQVPVEKIMGYCVPVLAERQHIAELAQRSHVRRKNAEGPARRLGQVVTERLRGRGVDPDSASWDAWRREDGRWSVTTSYRSGEHERSARFVFDHIGRYCMAEDDEAKWLTGERQSGSRGPQPRVSGQGGRRLSTVPTGEDLLSLPDEEPTDDLTAVVRAVGDQQSTEHEQAPADTDTSEAAESEAAESEAAEPEVAEPDPDEEPVAATEPPPKRQRRRTEPETEPTPKRKRRNRRASVPSWDEIMFGRGSDDESDS